MDLDRGIRPAVALANAAGRPAVADAEDDASALSVERATPKSITRPSPSALTMMLAGFRSRCTIPQ